MATLAPMPTITMDWSYKYNGANRDNGANGDNNANGNNNANRNNHGIKFNGFIKSKTLTSGVIGTNCTI